MLNGFSIDLLVIIAIIYFILFSIIELIVMYKFTYNVIYSINKSKDIEYYSLMADNLTDMITTLNPTGKIMYVSLSSETVLNYKSDELLNKNIYDFIHVEDKEKLNMTLLTARQSSYHSTTTYRVLKKGGQYVWFETTLKCIKDKIGNPVEIICVSRDITLRKKIESNLISANKKFKNLTYIDGLTEISNRRYFDETVKKYYEKAFITSKFISLIIIDVDYFKEFNDTYGHLEGDKCLKTIATTLNKTVRKSSDIVTRFGGEEFAVILPDTDESGAMHAAEKLKNKIEELKIINKNSKVNNYVTISMGINTIIPASQNGYESLIKNADKALYMSKKNGRNRIEKY
ncbi:MAG: cph2 1 [Clostridiaceae bacterium]|jgi:diguanylate cyclase (GGDEF)-like protein/PAS domain S-box-containing protein|nr:cph2 1 [Clostridiaceae bacterium]